MRRAATRTLSVPARPSRQRRFSATAGLSSSTGYGENGFLDLCQSEVPDHIQVEMRPSSTARFKATRHQRSLGALTAPAFRIGSLREPRQLQRCSHCARRFPKQSMPALTEDTVLIRRAIAYVIELYRELTAENGLPVSGRRTRWSNSSLPTPSCARQSRNGVKRPTRMRRRPSHSGACPVTRHTSAPGPISGG